MLEIEARIHHRYNRRPGRAAVATMSRETALSGAQPAGDVYASCFAPVGTDSSAPLGGFVTADGYFIVARLEGDLGTNEVWFSRRREALPLSAGTVYDPSGYIIPVDWQ